ncbi:MAG: hypothetical protein LBS36_04190 [Oscillospiraceae bacterium]|jgi:hypothetical protein|nr:hypothetical protein [Oscillospiraceae bacterium]
MFAERNDMSLFCLVRIKRKTLNIITAFFVVIACGYSYDQTIELRNYIKYGSVKYPISFSFGIGMVLVCVLVLILITIYRKRKTLIISDGFIIISDFIRKKTNNRNSKNRRY